MARNVTEPSTAQPVGPPPFDPELAPVVDALTSIRPPDAYRPDTIVEMRRPVPGVPTPTDDVLSRDGAYRVHERTVPGPDGDPGRLTARLPPAAREHAGPGDLLHPRRRDDRRRQPVRPPGGAGLGYQRQRKSSTLA
ncbi:hypothetical protein GCM10023215_45050 [Pseudonocardia yuanmonensis]|uniref:Uncharacterized protein n=1 Tax=Pseudonocardia yuanmonensis TaxID=1095914 RepID=A0ABP8X797_9PSEU